MIHTIKIEWAMGTQAIGAHVTFCLVHSVISREVIGVVRWERTKMQRQLRQEGTNDGA